MKLRSLITGNFVIKFWSLALAIVVWTVIQKEISITKVFRHISLDLKVPEEVVVVEKSFKHVQVTLEGPRDIVRDAGEEDIKFYYDLSDVKRSGAITFELSQSNFDIPARTKIVDIHPQKVTVVLDRMIMKTLEVDPNVIDEPMSGYSLKSVNVSPSYVSVIGPEMKMQDLSQIKTLPVLLTGRNRSFVQTVSLEPLVSNQDQMGLQQVELSVTIDRVLEKKVFEDVPIHILLQHQQSLFDAIVKPELTTVELEAMSHILEGISPETLKIYVDVSDLEPGKYDLPVNLIPILDIGGVEFEPSEVEVEIRPRLEV